MTVEALNQCSVKELAQMARKRGVLGWHSMRKAQLLAALADDASSGRGGAATRTAKPVGTTVAGPVRSGSGRDAGRSRRPQPDASSPAPPRTAARPTSRRLRNAVPQPSAGSVPPASAAPKSIAVEPAPAVAVVAPAVEVPLDPNSPMFRAKDQLARAKNLAYRTCNEPGPSNAVDRLVLMVRDPYWLHAYWELTQLGVKRAEAALAQQWHTAKPALRIYEVQNTGGGAPTEITIRTIPIHGGTNNWYVDVLEPPKSYRADVGYLAKDGKFFALAKSNVVNTPRAGMTENVDNNWSDLADNYDRVLAMNGGYSPDGPHSDLRKVFEERLRRPMQTMFSRNLLAGVMPRTRPFQFKVDAELIIHGSTEPDARVTLQGDPVQLRSDGTFTVRFNLPDCRQIIPAVACSADGSEQRTIVVAVERNTKVMEPVTRDCEE